MSDLKKVNKAMLQLRATCCLLMNFGTSLFLCYLVTLPPDLAVEGGDVLGTARKGRGKAGSSACEKNVLQVDKSGAFLPWTGWSRQSHRMQVLMADVGDEFMPDHV